MGEEFLKKNEGLGSTFEALMRVGVPREMVECLGERGIKSDYDYAKSFEKQYKEHLQIPQEIKDFGERLKEKKVVWFKGALDVGYGHLTPSLFQKRSLHLFGWTTQDKDVRVGMLGGDDRLINWLMDNFAMTARDLYKEASLRNAVKAGALTESALENSPNDGWKVAFSWIGKAVGLDMGRLFSSEDIGTQELMESKMRVLSRSCSGMFMRPISELKRETKANLVVIEGMHPLWPWMLREQVARDGLLFNFITDRATAAMSVVTPPAHNFVAGQLGLDHFAARGVRGNLHDIKCFPIPLAGNITPYLAEQRADHLANPEKRPDLPKRLFYFSASGVAMLQEASIKRALEWMKPLLVNGEAEALVQVGALPGGAKKLEESLLKFRIEQGMEKEIQVVSGETPHMAVDTFELVAQSPVPLALAVKGSERAPMAAALELFWLCLGVHGQQECWNLTYALLHGDPVAIPVTEYETIEKSMSEFMDKTIDFELKPELKGQIQELIERVVAKTPGELLERFDRWTSSRVNVKAEDRQPIYTLYNVMAEILKTKM